MCYQIPGPHTIWTPGSQEAAVPSHFWSHGQFSRDAQKQNGDGKKKLQVRASRHTELSITPRGATSLAQEHRATGQNFQIYGWLWPSSHKATGSIGGTAFFSSWAIYSSFFGLKSLTEDGYHTWLSFHAKTSSENIPESSGFTLPQRICEKNWPSTQPAGTSQWLPLQEMYIIKIECCSMNFIHTCPLGLFIRNNYLCLLSQEHIFYRVH